MSIHKYIERWAVFNINITYNKIVLKTLQVNKTYLLDWDSIAWVPGLALPSPESLVLTFEVL